MKNQVAIIALNFADAAGKLLTVTNSQMATIGDTIKHFLSINGIENSLISSSITPNQFASDLYKVVSGESAGFPVETYGNNAAFLTYCASTLKFPAL